MKLTDEERYRLLTEKHYTMTNPHPEETEFGLCLSGERLPGCTVCAAIDDDPPPVRRLLVDAAHWAMFLIVDNREQANDFIAIDDDDIEYVFEPLWMHPAELSRLPLDWEP